MSPDPTTPRPWWPYLAAALACAALGVFLLWGPRGEEPSSPEPAGASPSPAAEQRAARPPASAASPSEPPDSPRTQEPAADLSAQPLPSQATGSTSTARAEQARIEQEAVTAAVQGLSEQDRQRARTAAEAFIRALYTRDWQSQQQQWEQELAQTAAAPVVAQLSNGRDWQSQAWATYVAGKGRTQVRIDQAEPQNLTDAGVDVAVSFSTQTDAEDPWVAVAPTEHTETVVVDVKADPAQVIKRSSMEPAGGL